MKLLERLADILGFVLLVAFVWMILGSLLRLVARAVL